MKEILQPNKFGIFMIVALAVAIVTAGVMLLTWPDPPRAEAEAERADVLFWRVGWQEQGAVIYARNCATCHGFEGQGAEEIFPPLAGNALVTRSESALIITLLHGRGGMPRFDDVLDDEELAMVMSYIRASWGNQAAPLSPAQVRHFRVDVEEAPDADLDTEDEDPEEEQDEENGGDDQEDEPDSEDSEADQ